MSTLRCRAHRCFLGLFTVCAISFSACSDESKSSAQRAEAAGEQSASAKAPRETAQLKPALAMPEPTPASPAGESAVPSEEPEPDAKAMAAAAKADSPPPRWAEDAGPRKVLILGDSLAATGFGVVLEHKLKAHKQIDVARRGKSSSGLARPDFFDWMEESKKQVQAHDPDLVVVIIGGNDGQDLIAVEGKSPRTRWKSETWDSAYLERMHGFLSHLTTEGRRVLWLGLPRTDTKNFEAKMEVIRRVQVKALAEIGGKGRYLDTTPLLSDDSGALLRQVPAGKRSKPLRNSDGIHFTMAGSQYFADKVYPEVLLALEL